MPLNSANALIELEATDDAAATNISFTMHYEPKYGLAVTGSVHPDRILTNSGAQAGDALILTKPLGTGVLFNAGRSGKLAYPELEAILPQIAELNRKAMEVSLEFEVHASTDVTGFGILGHTLEMARGSHVQIDLFYDNLPFYANALLMYQKGETTGSNKANRKLAAGFWEMRTNKSAEEQALLFDPQTSGGLLIAVPDAQADDLIARLKKEGVKTAVRVGEIGGGDRPYIRVV